MRGWGLVLLLLPLHGALAAELTLPRLGGEVQLDGVGEEAAWQDVPPLPLVVYEPVYGEVPSERTELRVAHDDEALYVLARLVDSRPEDVRANSLYRDQYAGDDTVGVLVDPFNDDQNALWFYTTPAGTRTDGVVVADMASGQGDMSWNGHWEAAARQTSEGWCAELRIPFATLGFQAQAERVVMGLSVYRWLARHNERHVWPDVPPRWPRAYAKPSRMQDVVLEGVSARRAVLLTPYALLGRSGPGGLLPGAQGARPVHEPGLDVKVGLTPSLTLDASLNTDFAQVEADAQAVNLSRFPLFFPERRQFFLERAGNFDFLFPGTGRLFHSRRMGLVDGQPVRLLGGARLVGRVGAWEVGVLDMQAGDEQWRPTENLGVLRVRHPLLNDASRVGAMLTSRVDRVGRANLAWGLDGELRLLDDEYLTLRWAHSVDTLRVGSREAPVSGGRALASWQRRRLEGLSYTATLQWAGEGYEPGLGFEPRRAFVGAEHQLGYQWLLGREGLLRGVRLDSTGELVVGERTGRVETGRLESRLGLEAQAGHELAAGSVHRVEDVPEAFTLGPGLEVPAGRFHFHRGRVELGLASNLRLRTGLSLEAGSFFDGWGVQLRASPSWTPSRHLQLGGEYELNLLRFPARGQRADLHLARLRAQLALDTRASLAALLQYNSLTRLLSVNARLRYHFREGTDLWLVYDERAGADAGAGRALLLKYTHALLW